MGEDKPYRSGAGELPVPSERVAPTEDMVDEAAAWFARRLEGAEDARGQFDAWLAADPRHGAAYAAVARTWAGAGAVARAEVLPIGPVLSRRRFGRVAAGLGGAVIAAGGAWLLVPAFPLADHRTAKGERRTLTLADGSVVEMSTATALSFRDEGLARRVTLHAGEAYFAVAPAPSRPFSVDAAGGRATALGTAFAVALDRDGQGASVTVAEHAVSVVVGDETVRLAAGQRMRYAAARVEAPAPVDLDAALAWRGGRLVFVAVPLREVVESVDRWRSGRTLLMDDGLALRPVTVILDARRSDAMIDALGRVLPLKIVQVSRLLTLIYPADQGA